MFNLPVLHFPCRSAAATREWKGNWIQLIETSRSQLPPMTDHSIIEIAKLILGSDFATDHNKTYTERDRKKLIRKIQKAEKQYEKEKASIIQDHLERQSHFRRQN